MEGQLTPRVMRSGSKSRDHPLRPSTAARAVSSCGKVPLNYRFLVELRGLEPRL
jgi:hypothetical protein